MSLLIVSLFALAVGPLLYRAADSMRQALLALDGFVMIAVSGLVVVHIVPHAIAVAGPIAMIVALVGFLGPGIIESKLHRAASRAHTATLVLACVGLVVHAFLDGVALGSPVGDHGHEPGSSESASVLAIAVALHRLPVAVTIWWLLRPSAGVVAAASTLAALFVATICGYAFSGVVEAALDSGWVSLFQALVAGSLIHVVVHRPHPVSPPSSKEGGRIYAGLGAVVGLLLVAVLADTHMPLQRSPGESNFVETFVMLSLESAPALLLAFALAGLVQVYLPQWSFRWMHTGKPWSEAMRGVAFGLPLPVCSCGVIPLYRSLITRGVPASAAMAFLVATPELGLDAILISWPLLGGDLAIARVIASVIVALVVGAVVGRLADSLRSHTPDPGPSPVVVRGSFWHRVRLGLRFGFGEIVDHIGPWLLLGLVIASLAEPLIEGTWLTTLPWGIDVILFAIMGMPVYVCASGATPFIAVLLHKGVSPGAALAFLLAGPATNITTFGVLAQMHSRRVAFVFAWTMAMVAIAIGIGLNLIMDGGGAELGLHESAEHEPGWFPKLCLLGLTVVFLVSILRQGPREFVGQVIAPFKDHHDHDHDHGHDHGHDHDHDHDHGDGHGDGSSSSCSDCC